MIPNSAKPEKNIVFSTLDRESLVASGLRSERQIAGYIEKLDRMYDQMDSELDRMVIGEKKARALFYWLWAKKPSRYQSHIGPHTLGEVDKGRRRRDR